MPARAGLASPGQFISMSFLAMALFLCSIPILAWDIVPRRRVRYHLRREGGVGVGLKIYWREMTRLRLLQRLGSDVVTTLGGNLDGNLY